MRLTVDRDFLASVVPWAAKTLPSKEGHQVQVLAGLLLEAVNGALRVCAYDYEVAARGAVDARVTEEGRALVNGRMLADAVKTLPAARVELSVEGTRLVIASGSAKFQQPLLPSEDAAPGIRPR